MMLDTAANASDFWYWPVSRLRFGPSLGAQAEAELEMPGGTTDTISYVGSQSADTIKFGFKLQDWPVFDLRVGKFGNRPGKQMQNGAPPGGFPISRRPARSFSIVDTPWSDQEFHRAIWNGSFCLPVVTLKARAISAAECAAQISATTTF
jgi:hypothetical protein